MLKLVVLLKLLSIADPDDEQTITTSLQQLKQTLPGILSLSFGRNRLCHGDHDYTHIYMMDFVDEDYYKLFQEHPDTKAFLASLDERLAPTHQPKLVIEYPLEMILS